VNAAYAEGTYETTITEIIGVDRMTVRRWLGKLKVSQAPGAGVEVNSRRTAGRAAT
jgi:transposase